MNEGEVDIKMKGEKIKEVSFNSLFPAEYDESFCVCQPEMTPNAYLTKFNEWLEADQDSIQLRLIIAELNINEVVNIDDFTPEVRGGEVGDIYFSITFRTHRSLIIGYVDSSDNTYQGGLIDYKNRYFGDDTYKDGDKVKVVITGTVYEDADVNSTGLGYAYEGEEYTVYSYWNDWVQLYYGSSGGWIFKGFLAKM